MVAEELYLGEKKFISSKRAAGATGYASDYISQLCRKNKIPAKLLGKTWFVEEEALLKYKKDSLLAMKERGNALPKISPIQKVEIREEETEEKVSDESDLILSKTPPVFSETKIKTEIENLPFLPELKKTVIVDVSVKGLKTIKKNGAFAALKKAGAI